jgi:hypothetical protein
LAVAREEDVHRANDRRDGVIVAAVALAGTMTGIAQQKPDSRASGS